jgi:hypothetical protein
MRGDAGLSLGFAAPSSAWVSPWGQISIFDNILTLRIDKPEDAAP